MLMLINMPYLAEILGSKKILLTLMSRLEKHVTSLDCLFFYVVKVCKYVLSSCP